MKIIWPAFTALCVTGNLHAQSPNYPLSVTKDNPNWIPVEGLPPSELPKGTLGYFFYINEETGEPELYREIKKQQLLYVKSYGDACLYNTAKGGGAVYANGRLDVCSKMPFRATVICCRFVLKNGTPEFSDAEITDESARLLELGDSLLNEGDIAGAVDAYNGMMYPMSYMDETEKALQLLEKAGPQALGLYQRGHYSEAAETLGLALNFYGAWMLTEGAFDNMNDLEKYKADHNLPITDYLQSYSTDYGLYLYKAGRLADAVLWNAYLAEILHDYPNPCLAWADALYDLGQTTEAKEAYRQYKGRMERLGKAAQIPKRVQQRL